MVEKRKGTEYIPFMDADPDRVVVSMLEFEGKIYVATQKGVYIMRDKEFHRLEIVDAEDE